MSLQEELHEFRTKFMREAPADIRDAMARADLNLAASGILERALKAGDRAPDFRAVNIDGSMVQLSALLLTGPVVLSFYRGGWCPYCNLTLRALQRALPDFAALGASLVAIFPQTPDESLSTAEKNALDFAVVSDVGSVGAADFGIAFDLAAELRPVYTRFGHALPEKNGDESWKLPMPATFVIDRHGVIVLAFVDVDYRKRLEPAEITATLSALSARRAA